MAGVESGSPWSGEENRWQWGQQEGARGKVRLGQTWREARGLGMWRWSVWGCSVVRRLSRAQVKKELLASGIGMVRNGNVTSVGARWPHDVLTWDCCALGVQWGRGHQTFGVQERWEHQIFGVQEGWKPCAPEVQERLENYTLSVQGGWSPYIGGAGEWSTGHEGCRRGGSTIQWGCRRDEVQVTHVQRLRLMWKHHGLGRFSAW